ncbi:TlpA disulfide reductase family protein [Variovorax sp. PCZ-1]|uniref:peroxiredoxin family protein n=1 Tax=Variovorax sp. PCZ-1 TaxID=2835533 RepID=UPI001BCB1FFC|nr:TlpA disulfide reductase family protein [Variovorax sp. PCZ-1]MBS7806600.1 TlpA family protein disulfide reductase [Variovorax sp. PCZ-1]
MQSTALEWSVCQWFNTQASPVLSDFKGRVVVVSAFQMLCPGCVAHSIPQLKKLHELSQRIPLTVIGLHTVFEHHQAMQPHALEVFIHEYRLAFPIGVDAYDGKEPLPKTMRDWQMRGTPSTFVFAPNGELRLHEFGALDDMALGVVIGQLLNKT